MFGKTENQIREIVRAEISSLVCREKSTILFGALQVPTNVDNAFEVAVRHIVQEQLSEMIERETKRQVLTGKFMEEFVQRLKNLQLQDK